MLWTTCVAVLLALCVCGTLTFNPDNIQCCQCSTMSPFAVPDGVQPQILPSPFKIIVDPKVNQYSIGGEDINVNLTSMDENRSFRSFQIQARRTNTSLNIIEPIGTFTIIQTATVNGVVKCPRNLGSAFQSNDHELKKNVVLVWNPPSSFQGHVEFRASFIEDEKVYWVKEKSRPVYDPNEPMPPQAPLKYLPPPIPAIDVTGCGSVKGCYRLPSDCVELECEYIVTWVRLGGAIQFEMSAMTDGFNDRYFAFGLSDNIYMDNDLVFECVHDRDSGRVEVFQSVNSAGNDNKRLSLPTIGIPRQQGSYNNGRIRCRFTREMDPNDAEVAGYKLNSRAWHLLMARGPAARGNIMRHGMTVGHLPVASPNPVDLEGYDDISGRARYHLVKAHACLMLLAWVFFAPIGLIWMKYYSTMWPNSRMFKEKYWFVAHFNCTFWVVLLVVIGVILIFIEADGWSNFPELPQRAHPILGIIVFICVLIIPIIALIQCPPDHTCRPVGNWFYWLFWTIAYCLAIPNIFIGCDFGKANVPWWLTWILCIFFLFHLICEVILEVHQCCTHKRNKERRKKYELQKKENPNVHIPEPWPEGRDFKRNVLYTHFFVCLIVVVIAVITVAIA